ncbi:MAG TPA: hypothetical protein VF891_08210 [Gaiellaceae bacterium]
MRVERANPLVGALVWLGLLGPPLAWTAQLVLGYFAEDADCARGSGGWGFSSHTINAILFAAAAGIAVAGILGSVWVLQRAAERPEDTRGRIPFMALGAVLVSTLFGALVVMTGIGVLSFEACRAG